MTDQAHEGPCSNGSGRRIARPVLEQLWRHPYPEPARSTRGPERTTGAKFHLTSWPSPRCLLFPGRRVAVQATQKGLPDGDPVGLRDATVPQNTAEPPPHPVGEGPQVQQRDGNHRLIRRRSRLWHPVKVLVVRHYLKKGIAERDVRKSTRSCFEPTTPFTHLL